MGVEEELRQLRSEMEEYQRKQRYLLANMGMKRAWVQDKEDNLDVSHILQMAVYIPPDTKTVQRAYLRVRLLSFRSYGTGAAAGGAAVLSETSGPSSTSTTEAGGGDVLSAGTAHWFTSSGYNSGIDVTNFDGSHSHGGSTSAVGDHDHGGVPPDGGHSHTLSTGSGGVHSHTITADHNHNVTIPPHSHGMDHTHEVTVNLPNHEHELVHGIYTGPSATGVTILINGVDKTSALVGAANFSTDQDSLDVQPFLETDGWNTITFSSGTLGRIHASLFVEIYLP